LIQIEKLKPCVYYDILLAAWSQYSGHKKRRLPYFLTFFLLVLAAQYKPPYFNAFVLN